MRLFHRFVLFWLFTLLLTAVAHAQTGTGISLTVSVTNNSQDTVGNYSDIPISVHVSNPATSGPVVSVDISLSIADGATFVSSDLFTSSSEWGRCSHNFNLFNSLILHHDPYNR